MNKLVIGLVAATVLVLGGAGVYFWPALSGDAGGAGGAGGASEPAPVAVQPPVQPVQPMPLPAPAPAPSQPEAAAPQPTPGAPPLPPLAEADGVVTQALHEALGRASVLALLQTDGFVQRVVATVDNLPRPGAPSRVWPVNPAPGRFLLQGDLAQGPQPVHADNAARYDALVRMATALEPAQAAALYRRLYPLFQQAWREQGHPRGEFNTRLLQVLDHLLATPVPASPPQLTLTEVKGSVPSTMPWLRYEWADPALQGLSAGQRALLRTGPAHQQRLMAWLAALRQELRR
jgi:hypothetical protein